MRDLIENLGELDGNDVLALVSIVTFGAVMLFYCAVVSGAL